MNILVSFYVYMSQGSLHENLAFPVDSQSIMEQMLNLNCPSINLNSITYHLCVLDKLLNLSMPQFPLP